MRWKSPSSPAAAGLAAVLTVAALAAGCARMNHVEPLPPLSAKDAQIAEKIGLAPERLQEIEAKPLFRCNEAEVHDYLRYISTAEPDLRRRIVTIGRKNIGQPYELYLLGEAPFETYDPQPLYCLGKSDCVVFSEHTYAMALSRDWPSFFAMLQRIRYHEGRIGVATRNHYTEAQWDRNNSWLVRDITNDLGGADVVPFQQTIDLAKFLKGRYDLETDYEPFKIDETFIPYEKVAAIEDQLQPGTFVNIIRGNTGGYWAGHTGLITRSDDGTVNLLHSTPPAVKEQPLQEYIRQSLETNAKRKAEYEKALAEQGTAAKVAKGEVNEVMTEEEARGLKKRKEAKEIKPPTYFYGFKFLELRDDPIANLRELDGPAAPIVRPPAGSRVGG